MKTQLSTSPFWCLICLTLICIWQTCGGEGLFAQQVTETASQRPAYKHPDAAFEISVLPKGWLFTPEAPQVPIEVDACFKPDAKQGVVVAICVADNPVELILPEIEESEEFQRIKKAITNLVMNTFPEPHITSVALANTAAVPSIAAVFEYKHPQSNESTRAELHMIVKGQLNFNVWCFSPSSEFASFRGDFNIFLRSFTPAGQRDLSKVDKAYVLKEFRKAVSTGTALFPPELRASLKNVQLGIDGEKEPGEVLICDVMMETKAGCQAAKDVAKALPFWAQGKQPDFEPDSAVQNQKEFVFWTSALFGGLTNRIVFLKRDVRRIVLNVHLSEDTGTAVLIFTLKELPHNPNELVTWLRENSMKNLSGEFCEKGK